MEATAVSADKQRWRKRGRQHQKHETPTTNDFRVICTLSVHVMSIICCVPDNLVLAIVTTENHANNNSNNNNDNNIDPLQQQQHDSSQLSDQARQGHILRIPDGNNGNNNSSNPSCG